MSSGSCDVEQPQAAVYFLRGVDRIDRVRMKPGSGDREHRQHQDEPRNERETHADGQRNPYTRGFSK